MEASFSKGLGDSANQNAGTTKMLPLAGEEGHSTNENAGFLDTTNTACNRSNQKTRLPDTHSHSTNQHPATPDTTKTRCYWSVKQCWQAFLVFYVDLSLPKPSSFITISNIVEEICVHDNLHLTQSRFSQFMHNCQKWQCWQQKELPPVASTWWSLDQELIHLSNACVCKAETLYSHTLLILGELFKSKKWSGTWTKVSLKIPYLAHARLTQLDKY